MAGAIGIEPITRDASGHRSTNELYTLSVAGLEPATPGVQDRYSSHLSYTLFDWSVQQDSNLRPSAPKADALPD